MMRIQIWTIVAVILGSVLIAVTAGASLVPTSFGFPVITQAGNTTAFNQDTAFALDNEQLNLNIPDNFGPGMVDLGVSTFHNGAMDGVTGLKSAGALPFGPVDLAFPTVSQTVNQQQDVTHTDFAQTNEFAEFAYPFVGVGPVALPGFGFGF